MRFSDRDPGHDGDAEEILVKVLGARGEGDGWHDRPQLQREDQRMSEACNRKMKGRGE